MLLFFFAAVFIYGVVVGRNRIIVLLLASYPATLINEYVPYPKNFLNNLNIAQIIFLKSFIFFILIVFIFWIFKKSGFSRKELNKKTGQVLFLSFINVGLWANIIFGYVSVLNSQAIKLAPLTKLLFGSDWAHLIWFILPILVLYWFERK
ncbi:MAG: hypothetical protein UV48_C0014G0005 [Candidatus Azambacteria bacterium GW2011_GWA2_42_9]|uniref:Uncharacterized protein n=3 Tax=Candidatus Azamiibacteriota TaxID=1752741 RepID=A0A0G0ZBN1_9BACT|nr:MAG: hypothetical protein UV07_C0011G0020 [Candidatus Azambacteria bacterium GW2011_GWB1_42_17]KKS46110.1 MAG: hypothetical protein UV10_C0008G0020 [Candidatus Azambacteria bacterium GW2011_GWA1_42_19]KKS75322.1 MAG: hypothetical protein UV48_C0014G0005 [Candidatus Azambacteria bacterium GW2011_GWA2_42_9]KKS88289.1 MAG: hypothetical protein UV62_C0010G0018 [Parcubacteria group bacterium GW2011_GWC1_43_11]